MSTDLIRHALNGPTMGTRWSALFFAAPEVDPAPIQCALQSAVDEVDAQMSTWNPGSDLKRLNAAQVGEWITVPERLLYVLRLGLDIGKASGGAFDIGMGDAVTAWGFGPAEADPDAIRSALRSPRVAADKALEIDTAMARVRKTASVALDLNGIAKGYGTDRLAETLTACGISAALVGIDGEMRGFGLSPDDTPWSIAVEVPDADRRAAHSVLALQDASVATSGDYRHWVEVKGRRLSHTMDPRRGAPLSNAPASVTVVSDTCARADAWATALMVMGVDTGKVFAHEQGLDVLFLLRDADGSISSVGVGALFTDA